MKGEYTGNKEADEEIEEAIVNFVKVMESLKEKYPEISSSTPLENIITEVGDRIY